MTDLQTAVACLGCRRWFAPNDDLLERHYRKAHRAVASYQAEDVALW